ncbi:replication initiator protein [Chitinophaga polysaccharea]|uniref:Replication initiator protein n=1 Tax=Chitinophaga polysaccharea TaxID=1293035 RepID=A0A561P0V8_9BACT|nr:replication initiation protein [Chitinophaga polysaccharea]TWF31762.1 replication initiator protein [Chitinophaga polysaccharea]
MSKKISGKSLTVSENLDLTPSEDKPVKKSKALRPVDDTYIYQSNKVTMSKYNTSLLLERLLTMIQYQLQDAVRLSMRGEQDYAQLELFDPKSALLEIKIPLRSITKANSLDDVMQTCFSIMDLKISFPQYGASGKMEYLSLRQVVHGVDIPQLGESLIQKGKHTGKVRKYREHVVITMTRDQADRFIQVDYDPETQRPRRFTKFLLHTAMNAKTKYTARMYKLIASWKVKQTFTMNVDWLKEYLDIKGIDEKGEPFDLYPFYSDFKKRVLDPVMKELTPGPDKAKNHSDCWYKYQPAQYAGKKVISIRFDVITQEIADQLKTKHEYNQHLLRTHFEFDSTDFKSVHWLFSDSVDPDKVTLKLQKMHSKYNEDRSAVTNKKAWAYTSLKNFMAENE